jgi:hypothetical protein
VEVILDIVQQLLDTEPVNIQHTWITVLADCPGIQLGRLSSKEDSFSLMIQGSPHEELVGPPLHSSCTHNDPLSALHVQHGHAFCLAVFSTNPQ